MKKLLAALCIVILSLNLTGCMFFTFNRALEEANEQNVDYKTNLTLEDKSSSEEKSTTEEETTTEKTTTEEVTTKETAASASTLEEFYSTPEMQKQFEEEERYLLNLYSSIYSDIEYVVHGNTFSYVYTYLNEVDIAATKKNLEENFAYLDLDSSFEAIEKQSGITDITLEFVYVNKDGTEVYRTSATR